MKRSAPARHLMCAGQGLLNDAASIPIFAMSANAFVEDRQAAKEAGMDVHIAKPIDAELLKKKIAEYYR